GGASVSQCREAKICGDGAGADGDGLGGDAGEGGGPELLEKIGSRRKRGEGIVAGGVGDGAGFGVVELIVVVEIEKNGLAGDGDLAGITDAIGVVIPIRLAGDGAGGRGWRRALGDS